MATVADRLQGIRARIEAAGAGRPVTLLAVSKGHPAAVIREAWQAGQRLFGESYVQEALEKQRQLRDLPIEWHFIGPLQSNKTRLVAEHFDWVHSVDRLRVAERLAAARAPGQPPLNICLQVNVSGETSKSGVEPDGLPELAVAVGALPGLRLRGLMAIPEPTDDVALQRARFAQVRTLADRLRAAGFGIDTLSMGMSQDLESAVQEGATLVRIGTALFGPRERSATT